MLSSLPKISVVTPNYNYARFLKRTMDSVLDQRYPNLEYVVVDAASTDGSKEIIESYADRLAWWCSEEDGGQVHGINKGFAHTTGEIMAWINSDDAYHPWTFKTVADIFNKFPEVDWIMGTPADWTVEGCLRAAPKLINKAEFMAPGKNVFIQQESVFWRRSLWEKAGGYLAASQGLIFDTELWCRFFKYSRLHHVDAILSGCTIHKAKRSFQGWDQYVRQAEVCKRSALDSGSRLETTWLERAHAWNFWARRSRLGNKAAHVILEKMNRRIYLDSWYPIIRHDDLGCGDWVKEQVMVDFRK